MKFYNKRKILKKLNIKKKYKSQNINYNYQINNQIWLNNNLINKYKS